MCDICGDNRFILIDKAKQDLLKKTNIESDKKQMEVLDSFLFRCWQMGWLEKYNEVGENLKKNAIKPARKHLNYVLLEDGQIKSMYFKNPDGSFNYEETLHSYEETDEGCYLYYDEFKSNEQGQLVGIALCKQRVVAESDDKDELIKRSKEILACYNKEAREED